MATEKYQQLMAEYRRLAKRADQRLVRIEKYASPGKDGKKGFEKLTSYAYRNALHDIQKWSGADAKRFNVAPPNNTAQLKAKIADIRKFLESATSTLKGTKAAYQNRVNTINEKYGTSFTWEQFAEFTHSKMFEKLDSRFYMGNAFRAIGVIQENEDTIIKGMKNHNQVHIKTDDMILDETVNSIIKDYGKEIKQLFK